MVYHSNLVQTYVSQKSQRRRNNGRTIRGLFQGALDQGPGAVKGQHQRYIHSDDPEAHDARYQVKRPGSYENTKSMGKPGCNRTMPGPMTEDGRTKSHTEEFWPYYSDLKSSRRYTHNPHATKKLGKLHTIKNQNSPNNSQGSLDRMPGGTKRAGNLHFQRSGEFEKSSVGSVGLDRDKAKRIEQISTRRLRIRRRMFK